MKYWLRRLVCRHDWFRHTTAACAGRVQEYRTCSKCGKAQRRTATAGWHAWP